VTVLRGKPDKVRHLGDELLATKGVLHGDITFTSGEHFFSQIADAKH
jgi:metal-responsive CopG/Arc/MetJ family transcriptional regulator